VKLLGDARALFLLGFQDIACHELDGRSRRAIGVRTRPVTSITSAAGQQEPALLHVTNGQFQAATSRPARASATLAWRSRSVSARSWSALRLSTSSASA